jgi:apolipoprotein N-acyltransferase
VNAGMLTAQPPRGSTIADPTVKQLIARARSTQTVRRQRPPVWGCLVLSTLTGLLCYIAFPPLNFSPLAWLAPVPLCLLVRLPHLPLGWWWAAWLGGLTFTLPALQWLRLGDPTMYLAWWALASYLALSLPLMLWTARVAVHQWRLPLVIALPAVWVGADYLKAHLLTGFAWYYLGHTQYRWLELIQISDLVGAYGVTAIMVAAAVALSGLVPASWMERWRLLPRSADDAVSTNALSSSASAAATASVSASVPGSDQWQADRLAVRPAEHSTDEAIQTVRRATLVPVGRWTAVATSTVLAAVLVYGFARRQQADFQPGPRTALIQANFVASLRIEPETAMERYLAHLKLTGIAVRQQPDLIVWPEGMVPYPLFEAPAHLTEEELRRRAPEVNPELWTDTSVRQALLVESQKTNAAMIFGLESVTLTDQGHRVANSAQFVAPQSGLGPRYDKRHLVPFGEYLPLQDTFPWLHQLTPYPPNFGLDAGTKSVVFEHNGWRMSPVICFEDTVPHLVRGVVAQAERSADGRPLDVLVNLSNDGWFHGSSGLDQHLITAAFRAVECRVPIVRAVNTGISAVIDGDGAILSTGTLIDASGPRAEVVKQAARWEPAARKQKECVLVQDVPLDPRRSWYVWWGDWFAGGCATVLLGLLAASLFNGLRAVGRRTV